MVFCPAEARTNAKSFPAAFTFVQFTFGWYVETSNPTSRVNNTRDSNASMNPQDETASQTDARDARVHEPLPPPPRSDEPALDTHLDDAPARPGRWRDKNQVCTTRKSSGRPPNSTPPQLWDRFALGARKN